MFENRHAIVIVLGIYFVKVGGDDPDALGQNYSRVFKDMPALFELIMEMLQEKPEVLERNDVTTFFDNEPNQASQLSPDEVKFDKRDANFDYDFIDNFGNTEAEHQYDVNLLRAKANDDFEGFIGSVGPGGSQLITADEMVEMMLMVERKLEDYNHDND